jgi:hemimethylated DNA binding protein
MSQRVDACRWDVRCCEDVEWQAENGVDSLDHGSRQPFYHILVDLRDWEDGNPQNAIAYVPEEVLMPAAVSCATANCCLQGRHPA